MSSATNSNITKSALITGCGAGGIGHALAQEFARNGYTTFATLLPHESREHLEPHGIHCYTTDVTSDESVLSLLHAIQEKTAGNLDVLVNNAFPCDLPRRGLIRQQGYTMPATDTEIDEVEKVFAVNVFGAIRMLRVFHPLLIEARGTMVNIGSVGGIVPYVYGSAYNASKAALVHWGDTVRTEMKPFGVKVLSVISGEIGTNVLKRDENRTLPPNSVFAPISADFVKHVNRTPETMPASEYARGVVAEVMKGSPKNWYWRGARAAEVWFYSSFFSRKFWDGLFYKEFGLGRLERRK